MKPSDRLAAARTYIIEHGLAFGTLEARDGKVCSLGALRLGADQWDLDGFETDCLAKAALELGGREWGAPFNTVSNYSDDCFRAQRESDVHAMFDRAIILAKEAESA